MVEGGYDQNKDVFLFSNQKEVYNLVDKYV